MIRRLVNTVTLVTMTVILAGNVYSQRILTGNRYSQRLQEKRLYVGGENFGIKPTIGLVFELGYLGTPVKSIKNVPEELRTVHRGDDIFSYDVVIEDDKLKSLNIFGLFNPRVVLGGEAKLGAFSLEALVEKRFVKSLNLSIGEITRDNPQIKSYRTAHYVQQIVEPEGIDYNLELKLHLNDMRLLNEDGSLLLGYTIDSYKHLIERGYLKCDGTCGDTRSGGTGLVSGKEYVKKQHIGDISEKTIYTGLSFEISYGGKLDQDVIGSCKFGINFNDNKQIGHNDMDINMNKIGWFYCVEICFKY